MNRLKKSLHKKDHFATPTGKLVEQITAAADPHDGATLDVLDPAVEQLCQLLTNSESGARDAVKAIRSRMVQAASRNHAQLARTLNLLEILVSNCDARIHAEVASQKFLDDLKAVLSPKYTIPESIRLRIYALLESWCTAFRGRPELASVQQFYDTIMRSSSVQHETARRSNSRGPHGRGTQSVVLTPPQYDQVVVPMYSGPQVTPSATYVSQAAVRPPPQPEYRLTAESIRKIEVDLETITNNVMLFHDIMNSADMAQMPDLGAMGSEFGVSDAAELGLYAQENPPDWETALSLVGQCRAMQSRLHELINWINSPAGAAATDCQLPEALLARILEVNDDLSNMFQRAANYNVEARATEQQNRAGNPPHSAAAAGVSVSPPPSFYSVTNQSPPRAAFAVDGGQRLAERQVPPLAASLNNPPAAQRTAAVHRDLLDLRDPSEENVYSETPQHPVAIPAVQASSNISAMSSSPNPLYGELASVFSAPSQPAPASNAFAAPASGSLYPQFSTSFGPPAAASSNAANTESLASSGRLGLAPRHGPLPPVPGAVSAPAPQSLPPVTQNAQAGWTVFDEANEANAHSQPATLPNFEQLSLSAKPKPSDVPEARVAPAPSSTPSSTAQATTSRDDLISF